VSTFLATANSFPARVIDGLLCSLGDPHQEPDSDGFEFFAGYLKMLS